MGSKDDVKYDGGARYSHDDRCGPPRPASMSRPEHIAPPELFYNETEAQKYTAKYERAPAPALLHSARYMPPSPATAPLPPSHRPVPLLHWNTLLLRRDPYSLPYCRSSRMIEIQRELTQRCLELLALPEGQPSMILDVGCGSGLSGQELTDSGHVWVGMDISPSMLEVAVERDCAGDVMQHDMGQGVPFRPGTFDGVISVSALQWLFNADKRSHHPRNRFKRFFTMLYSAMARGARAVFQFYPETPDQMEMVTQMAMKAGFGGGLVVDFPNSTRAKK